MKDDYKNKLASKIASRYQDLEERIMQDIVRRIMKAGEITSTADWQINRLRILGYSSEDIEKEIKKALNASYPEMFELYDKVINWEYVRNKDIYMSRLTPSTYHSKRMDSSSRLQKQSLTRVLMIWRM